MPRPAPEVPLRRFYLHVPQPIFDAAHAAAKADGISVSRWISRVLKEKVDATENGG